MATGGLVLVIPGLFGSDVYLGPLRSWLRRIGYRPVRSTMLINAGCPDRLRARVESALRQSIDRHPGPVAIIGHSRGGMLGWAIASRLQAEASHLVLLGSPAPAVVMMMRARPEARRSCRTRRAPLPPPASGRCGYSTRTATSPAADAHTPPTCAGT